MSTPNTPELPPAEHPRGPFAALQSPSFRLLVASTFLSVVGSQILNIAIGGELYERTRSTLALGLVGLVQVVPVVALALPAGQLADRMDRQRIAAITLSILALCTLGLALNSALDGPVGLVYLFLLIMGFARAFQGPAISSLTSQVVPPANFANAATWESSAWQSSSIAGPAAGGILIALFGRAAPSYLITTVMLLLAGGLLLLIRPRPIERSEGPLNLGELLAGMRFIWQSKVILAALSLDMVAVLLGGATALLPVFARDLLQVGATGLGWLQAAPAIGAVLASLTIAYLPPFRHAGRTLLLAVAGFGLITIVFGLSRSFPLSLLALGLIGALDSVSVVIRGTLVLTRTPDALRGRVSAANFVFIGISNELGAFESGVAASFLGAVGAVVAGGIGTILVVLLVTLIWPELRRLRGLNADQLVDSPMEP
jgi:MFS family permease